jgi:hypothetical protein
MYIKVPWQSMHHILACNEKNYKYTNFTWNSNTILECAQMKFLKKLIMFPREEYKKYVSVSIGSWSIFYSTLHVSFSCDKHNVGESKYVIAHTS